MRTQASCACYVAGNRRAWVQELKSVFNGPFTTNQAADLWMIEVSGVRSRLRLLEKVGYVRRTEEVKWPTPLPVVWELTAKGRRP